MERGINIAFRDIIFNSFAAFAILLIILISHVRPEQVIAGETKSPGNLIAECQWKEGTATDVDMWVKAPLDIPIGYSNLNGRVFNLLRDDLGNVFDYVELNYENAYTRGLPVGEYIVNVHLYSNNEGTYPVTVRCQVSIKSPMRTGNPEPRLASTVELLFQNHEITVFRFEIDEDGDIIPATVSTIFKPLRAFTEQQF